MNFPPRQLLPTQTQHSSLSSTSTTSASLRGAAAKHRNFVVMKLSERCGVYNVCTRSTPGPGKKKKNRPFFFSLQQIMRSIKWHQTSVKLCNHLLQHVLLSDHLDAISHLHTPKCTRLPVGAVTALSHSRWLSTWGGVSIIWSHHRIFTGAVILFR